VNNTTDTSVVSRAALLGDELTNAIEAYAKEPTAAHLSDFSAALVGRCASMAAAAVVTLHERVADLEAARDGDE
jgi:hypothetical protein